MSHWVKTTTKMKEKKYMMAGLKAMGIEAQEGNNLTIRGHWSSSRDKDHVDIKINEGVGLRQTQDGSWEMVGDFYGTRHSQWYGKDKQFMEKLQGQYCVAQVKDRISQLPGGWTFTDNEAGEVDEDGFITMRAQTFFQEDAMSKEVRIIINPKTLQVEYEVSGVAGPSCTDITDQLVQEDEVLEAGVTDEYHIPLPQPEYVTDGEED